GCERPPHWMFRVRCRLVVVAARAGLGANVLHFRPNIKIGRVKRDARIGKDGILRRLLPSPDPKPNCQACTREQCDEQDTTKHDYASPGSFALGGNTIG